ncbi:MAG: hypothetical protein H6719_16440 [Sandaracinaceae bacterium]|nr:hypothetical protein [Sandaracinaceae bacterium]
MHRSCRLRCLGLAALTLAGCYRSHRVEDAPDASPRDAGRRLDGGFDAGFDAGDLPCTGVRVAATVAIDDPGVSSVTPRLVAIPGGDVGLVHVSSDGSPTRVRFERLSPSLDRLASSTVATDSFTWAEPAVVEGELWVAYGRAGDEPSILQHVSRDGAPLAERVPVPLPHPSVLQPWREGLFWMAFDMRTDNSLVLAHLSPTAGLAHDRVVIDLGRYGSGHGAIPRPDGRSHVITYPREGPPGVREGYVNALTGAGALGPERQVSDDGAELVLPVRVGDELVLVIHGDALILERTDFETLERLDRATFPALPSRPFFVGSLAGRVLVGHVTDGVLELDDFGEDLAGFERLTIRPPDRANGPSGSVLEVPGAVFIAFGVVAGSRSYPFVARVECAR